MVAGKSMNRLCVYCGSSSGSGESYVAAAKELATLLVTTRTDLVYGGSHKGIMGVLADAVLRGGGKAYGVIPKSLYDKEVAHDGLTELHVVNSMHERKSLMAVLADGFVAMPGGFGTLEEIIEVLTWGQLQFHDKPCGLLNVEGFFDHLLQYLDHAAREGFLRAEHREMLLVANTPAGLLDLFASYEPPIVKKWVDSERQN
jgi:uncharacterized protein (TIGR00730 family)